MSPASASGSKLHSNFRAAPLRNVAKSNPRTTILLPAAAFDEGDSSNSSKNEKQTPQTGSDLTIRNTALSLRRTSWLSWWIQVILTTVSGITLVFTRGINNANTGYRAIPSGGLVLAGSGITLSILSILWTWGGARLSRRLLRNKNPKNSSRPYNRIDVATRIRRTVTVGAYLNILGMFITLLGAEQIVGLLAAKALTSAQGVGAFGVVGSGIGGLASQTLQPLDILVVQANTNTLLSHFASLVSFLYLTRSLRQLDPPSTEED